MKQRKAMVYSFFCNNLGHNPQNYFDDVVDN